MAVNKKNVKKFNKKSNKYDKCNQKLKLLKKEQNTKNRAIKKIKDELDKSFIKFMVKHITEEYPDLIKQNNLRKYSLETILEEILYFFKSGISYSHYKGKISKSLLNYYVQIFSKNKIFISTYRALHNEYSKNNFYDKLKYLSIDTSFIINKSANYPIIDRNKYMKNKNGIKISCITDSNGFPIDIIFTSGNRHDSPLLIEHFKNGKVNTNSEKIKNNNRYKQYFLADAGYCSKDNRNFLIQKGYTPIIPINKRRSCKESPKMTKKEEIIYKKRIVIENLFSKLKHYKRINNLYDKSFLTYGNFVYLGLSLLIYVNIMTH